MTQPEDEVRRRQRGAGAACMALLLGAFVVLMFAITIAKMGDQPVTSAGPAATPAPG